MWNAKKRAAEQGVGLAMARKARCEVRREARWKARRTMNRKGNKQYTRTNGGKTVKMPNITNRKRESNGLELREWCLPQNS